MGTTPNPRFHRPRFYWCKFMLAKQGQEVAILGRSDEWLLLLLCIWGGNRRKKKFFGLSHYLDFIMLFCENLG